MGLGVVCWTAWGLYSRSQKVGNPIASILKSNVSGIPALFGLHPVSNFMGFTIIRKSYQGTPKRKVSWVSGRVFMAFTV